MEYISAGHNIAGGSHTNSLVSLKRGETDSGRVLIFSQRDDADASKSEVLPTPALSLRHSDVFICCILLRGLSSAKTMPSSMMAELMIRRAVIGSSSTRVAPKRVRMGMLN